MCGFSLIYKSNVRESYNDVQIQNSVQSIVNRGPDQTNIYKDEKCIFIHTLLSITGYYRVQPKNNDNYRLIYNGELYNDYLNYSDSYGDSDWLWNTINDDGINNLDQYDGEYAICIEDKRQNELHLISDPFGTKPFYYQLSKSHVAAASYESSIRAWGEGGDIVEVPANKHIVIDLNTYAIKLDKDIVKFDFSNATKNHFDDWINAFKKSIKKRATNTRHSLFVPLSSGHDSGAIVAELMQQNISFKSYIFPYKEDVSVLDKRIELLKMHNLSFEKLSLKKEGIVELKEYLYGNCEPYLLISKDHEEQNFKNCLDIKEISGYVSLSMIMKKAKGNLRNIGFSGQGADEIISDYYNSNTNSRMSEIRGQWENVKAPWKNFFGGYNNVLLNGGERIAGAYGIETRYPFLDKELVQEYLYISPDLKKSAFKAPIQVLLEKYQFPYHTNKVGFTGYETS